MTKKEAVKEIEKVYDTKNKRIKTSYEEGYLDALDKCLQIIETVKEN